MPCTPMSIQNTYYGSSCMLRHQDAEFRCGASNRVAADGVVFIKINSAEVENVAPRKTTRTFVLFRLSRADQATYRDSDVQAQ